MFKFLRKLFCKDKPEVGEWVGSVHQIKEYLPIEHPLKYVKEHGNPAQIAKARRLARQGKGQELRKLAKEIQITVE